MESLPAENLATTIEGEVCMNVMNYLGSKKGIRTAGLLLLVVTSLWIGTKIGALKNAPVTPAYSGEKSVEAAIWTCSMHPQIKMPKPGKCPICFMDLIPLTHKSSGTGSNTNATRLSMSENAKILAGIVTTAALRRGMNANIRMTGKIAFDETRVELITSRIAGRIERLYVDYTGVTVKAGDHLAEIYSPELVSLQRELLEAAKSAAATGSDASEMLHNSRQRTFDATKEKLRLLGFSERELTDILERGTTANTMTIRTKQRGVVLRKLVEEGSYVQTGTPLFHIADLTTLWVLLDAYESDISWLRLGQKADFSVEAFPGKTFSGTISFIDPVVSPQTRTVKVRVVVDNKDGILKPDMFVKATVAASLSKSGAVKNTALRGKWISPMHPQIVKDHPGTCDICGMPLVRAEELGYVTSGFEEVDPLVIPATAPLYTGERSLVYIEVPGADEPTYEAREVVLGPRVEGYYIIKSGIAEGDKVVVNGAFKIDGELQIHAQPSMMNPQPPATAPEMSGVDMLGHGNTDMVPQIPSISKEPVTAAFTAELQECINSYLSVSDALAKDDLPAAKKGLEAVKALSSGIVPPKGEQYAAWKSIQASLAAALAHTPHIGEIADARSIFEKVSTQMITLERQHLKNDATQHFLAFCPMAFNNSGAYWIQKDSAIKNPYFGTKMLQCGEIKDEL